MHLHRPHSLPSQVRREEGTGGGVNVNQDGVVTDRPRQDVGDGAEVRERVLPEEEGCAAKSQFDICTRLGLTYGFGFLSTPL